MKFPLQLQYELTLDDTRKVFDLVYGKKEKRGNVIRTIFFSVMALIFFCSMVYALGQAAVSVHTLENGTLSPYIDYSNLNFSKVNWQMVGKSALLMVICIAMAIFYNIYTRRRMESIVKDRHKAMHGGIVVLGRESFLFRSDDGRIEVNKEYKDLYEAYEDADFFALITGDQTCVPIPKSKMETEQFAELSKILSIDLKEYFFKNGYMNTEVEMKTIFGDFTRRKIK